MDGNYIYDSIDANDQTEDVCDRTSDRDSENESDSVQGHGKLDLYGEERADRDSCSIKESIGKNSYNLPATSWGYFR